MAKIDKSIQVNTVIKNQLPDFVVSDFPNAIEFFKQYYISQEFQGGPTDLVSNFDQYLKVDNLVPEVIVGTTTLSSEVDTTSTTISVISTKGFPDQYGLLKIDNEIISYTSKTDTTFVGCSRGFSGITGYNVGISSSLLDVNKETLVFDDTISESHKINAVVTNLSVLFLQEFFKKLKKTFLPGFEEVSFSNDLDVGNFIKIARTFYQSKGIEESITILYKVLFGVEAKVLDLEENLIKPSGAEFIRREVIVAEQTSLTGDPANLVGQTVYKSTDNRTQASVSEVEPLTRENKLYYKISLFVGYSDRDLIEGTFTIPGNTRSLEDSPTGSSTILVDSTVGFGKTGTLISGTNTINYTSKTINQFFGCDGIVSGISTSDNVRSNEVIFGYENGDLNKKVELRITGVLSSLETISDISLVTEKENIYVKNVGEKIRNPKDGTSSYKEIFANSWVYNTSCRYQVERDGINGSTFTLPSVIESSSLKEGDTVSILGRNSQSIESGATNGSITNVNTSIKPNTVNIGNLSSWSGAVSGKLYDIRRNLKKASSTGVTIKTGNDSILTDVLNVYTDKDADGYVISNSLPNYPITTDLIKEEIVGVTTSGTNPTLLNEVESGKYTTISFAQVTAVTSASIKFVKGDSIVYTAGIATQPILGLVSGNRYYIDVLENTGNYTSEIQLYNSRGEQESDNPILLQAVDAGQQHTFTLERHYNRLLDSSPVLRKFPLVQNPFLVGKGESPTNTIGILVDGVELRSSVSDDNIYYGPISKLDLFNGGSGYDVLNPPKVVIEDSIVRDSNGLKIGIGETALVEPILEGSVEEVFVDPQDFDIDEVTDISITGGNGSGCVLEAITGPRFRELEFDSRDIFFNGGISIEDETITFKTQHNFANGEKVFYNSNGNTNIGIGAYKDAGNTITGTLANGAPYYVGIVNSSTIHLYNSESDALSGINTVGLSTDTNASGVHKFRTVSKNTIKAVKVINSGSGYQYRKLHVKPSGISTSFDTINYEDHGFKDGELINYSPTVGIGSTYPKAIGGLEPQNSYYVMKVDDNSFRLADAGIGGTSVVDFNRGKFVGLQTTGTGYQTFTYPEVTVTAKVSYASSITGDFVFTPIVTGKLTGSYVYEQGTKYGSVTVNHQKDPLITIQNGKNAELKPLVSAGKIVDVVVMSKGSEFYSLPKLVVSGSGNGAVLKPIISDGKLQSVLVINGGIGYDASNTSVYADPRGINGLYEPRVRNLTINSTKRFGEYYLNPQGDTSLGFNVVGYNQDLALHYGESFTVEQNGNFKEPSGHSPIIGWAYDGNPIYGPFGYMDPDDINSNVGIITSGYVADSSRVPNRPVAATGTLAYDDGFFIQDYFYDGTGDLDEHNGRFCKTPEFPNGVYAYFACVDVSSGLIKPQYPYFIGKTYRAPLIKDNHTLDHDFDFNSTNLLRNTQPYKVGDKFADNDFIVESNETIRQLSNVESVTTGDVTNIGVLDGGFGYKVGDYTDFDDTDTNGSGLRAQVDEIVGIGVSRIDTQLDRFEDVTFVWNNNEEVIAHKLPNIELNNQDTIAVSGLSTVVVNLTNSFSVGVKTDTIGLAKTMSVNSNALGAIEDIFVTKIPNTVSIGGSLRISDEVVKVLNIHELNSAITVKRFAIGIAHSFGTKIDVLNNRISIPVRTEKFESVNDDLVFFNGPKSIGVGTTAGGSVYLDYPIGEIERRIYAPTRTIFLPKHPFKTGQQVKLTKHANGSQINVGNTPTGNQFSIPQSGSPYTDTLYVINKDEDHIGLVTTRAGLANTSDGVYFFSNGTNALSSYKFTESEYSISSDFTKITGDIDRIVSTVTTKIGLAQTTTHGLNNDDVVKMNVIPSTSVGIGTTDAISVNWNEQYQKLLLNPIQFTNSSVKANQLNLIDHKLKTGDKVFYEGSATGLSTGSYYAYKISDDYIELGETYIDVTVNPTNTLDITENTGGTDQRVSLINPPITVVKNSQLTFGLSSTTLSDFTFKVFYDNEFKNEYYSSTDSSDFNIVGVGTIGIGTSPDLPVVGASLTVSYSNSSPSKIYYALERNGYISTSDTGVQNYSEINFVDSAYSGEFKVFGISSDTFKISPYKTPEFLSYTEDECSKLEYSTRSTSVTGSIKDLKVISKGYNYKKLPKFLSVKSANGQNANLVAISTSIGRIKDVRIVDIGYEYASDKTLSPEAFVSPIINLDNLDVIKNINIVYGGSEYLGAPDLVLYNPEKKEIVDEVSLISKVPNQSISEVEIFAPIRGLQSVTHKLVSVNNSNGVGINSMTGGGSGIVTCVLETPITGFAIPPFAAGDEIFVEGIQLVGESGIGTQANANTGISSEGTGYNSKDYEFRFFKVESFVNSNPAVLKYSVAGLTTNPGFAKTFQSGYATIVNKNNYPILEPIQERGEYQIGEKLLVNSGGINFQETDLVVVDSRDDYIRVDGLYELQKTDIIKGQVTDVSATVTSFVENKAKFNISYSNRQDFGWLNNTGKLNDDYQVIPDNDYYQNLSYSVKSPIEWENSVDPLNRVVHPAGLKNFADVGISSSVPAGISSTHSSSPVLILDVMNDVNRVDTINNLDLTTDYDSRTNPLRSKYLQFENLILTDYTKCKSNRALQHDDISGKFSSKGLQDLFTEIEEIDGLFANYIVQITDPDTFDTQLSEVVVLTKTSDAILFEKTTDFTNSKLGDFIADCDFTNRKTLRFEPTEKYEKDHDIKVLKFDFNTDLETNVSQSIGHIDLKSSNVGIASTTVGFNTTTIAQFSHTDFNALQANILVQDDITREINYSEVIVDFDGTNTYIAENYIDTVSLNYSSSRLGIITARYESGNIKLDFENDRDTKLTLQASIVGLGTTTAGTSVYRYSLPGQPAGAERSARYESTFASDHNPGIGITFSTLNNLIDSSSKSLIRVSCGETSAIHQLIAIRDVDDIVTVQYPFVSAGSTTGIGTFGGEISGNDINLKFYPDSEFNSLIEVQAYSKIFYTASDFENTPPDLDIGAVTEKLFLSAYDGPNGERANKVNFDLKHEGIPIYSKIFNPSDTNALGVLPNSSGICTISNHFFNTGEELTYTANSTFIGVGATPVSIGSTANNAGIVTTLMPSTVYAKVLDENRIQLFSQKSFVSTGNPIVFTGIGEGNAHRLEMTKKLSKTVIGLDGIIQQPVTYTTIEHSLDGAVGLGVSQFALSGISSVQPRDVLKVGSEYMKVEQVGFASVSDGIIDDATNTALGISTIPVVSVARGSLGIGATTHQDGDVARVHRGSFNIVNSTVWFLDPPKGNTRERRSLTNLPYVKAEFNGRTFTRSDYDTNMVFDDISDSFTGIGRTYTLSVGGANTETGVGIGNGILFINGVFQTPLTVNNTGNNYEFDSTNAGISSVVFTGISSENGTMMQSEFDINQNQLPRGGIIVSLGSTSGLGYAPLKGSLVQAFKDTADNSLDSIVGIGTSSGVSLGIQTASYSHITGIITVTTNEVHGLSLGEPKTVKLENLEFKCSTEHAGVTTTIFNDDDRALSLVGIISERSVEVKAGVCTIPHVYQGGGDLFEFYSDLNTGSGYREPVSIGVSDTEYIHNFVGSTNNSITANTGTQFTPSKAVYSSSTGDLLLTIGTHNLQGATTHTVENASYVPSTGILTITITGHNFSNGDYIKIKDNSLTFKCSMGSSVNKTYPRPNDPISNKWMEISNVATNTFTIDVGASPIVNFNVTDANYDPVTGLMELTIGSHSLKPGTSIKLANQSIGFSCDVDNNATTKFYPRSTDPFYDTPINIESVTDTTITLQVLTTIPSTNTTQHTFVSANPNAVISGGNYTHEFQTNQSVAVDCLKKANNTVDIANNSLTFTCSRDNHLGEHTYPRSTDPASGKELGVDVVSSNLIRVNVGAGGGGGYGGVVTAKVAGNKHKFVTATAGAAFTGSTQKNVTDADYNPATGWMQVTSASHGFVGCSTITPTNANYAKTTGILTLTKNGHGFNVGDYILIEDNSLTFTCTKDGGATEHSYPRPTDYASGKWLQITNKTVNTFKVNVNPNPSSEQYDHTFVPARTVNGCISKANQLIEIAADSLTFTCEHDHHQSLHNYPRVTDPIYNAGVPVGKTATNWFRINVGKSPAGTGGALDLKINEVGGHYVNPVIEIPSPSYDDVPVEGISRLGRGLTKATGSNLLVDLEVGAAKTSVGIGSTFFEISNFQVSRHGHSFKIGDKVRPIGLVHDKRLQKPIQEFELEVNSIFNDYFAAWQFGEIDFIDSIESYQDGTRTRFPLFFNGQLLSFMTDPGDTVSEQIDLDAVLLIFINGVLQTPKVAYQFNGGTTFKFTEPPDTSDNVDIFFYIGDRNVDVEIVDIQETLKVGDDLRVYKSPLFENSITQDSERVIKSIQGSDIVETNVYTGTGINEDDPKPLRWTKQKEDLSIKGDIISKSRSSIEPQIYPTARVIGDIDLTTGVGVNGGIFVDDSESFYYEDLSNPALEGDDRYNVSINSVDTLLISGSPKSTASVNAVVSAAGTVQTLTIVDGGSGYTAAPTISIGAPIGVGVGTETRDQFAVVGVSTFATATATITDGSVTSVVITNEGLGYSQSNPPKVTVDNPSFKNERILSASNVEGYTGVITSIKQVSGIDGHSRALEFGFVADKEADKLKVGYPILVSNTKVSSAITSVEYTDNDIVSIGSTFLDNIYKVHAIWTSGQAGIITCNVLSSSNIVGLVTTGYYNPAGPGGVGFTTSLGRITWGRIFDATRSDSPVSIGVTGLTVDSGLSTFPTIQRRSYTQTSIKGLRSTGAIRAFGITN